MIVDFGAQRILLVRNRKIEKNYPISGGKNGVGATVGNWQTPPGMFKVASKGGDRRKIGQAVGDGKFPHVYQPGETVPRGTISDLLTRAVYLTEIEDGVNKGGKLPDFHIALHGTRREDLIGQPASHGCVRMRNADIAELYEFIGKSTLIDINNNRPAPQNVASLEGRAA